jgi:O-antigen/teichoic acid export membrane protein
MKSKNVPAAFADSSKGYSIASRRSGAKLARFVSGTHLLALADQAIVSGASFVSTVVIARACGASELGIYAIGISVLTILISVQDSVVLTPYSIQRHQPVGTPEEHAGASFVLSASLAGLAMLIFATAASMLSVFGIAPRVAAMAWALAVVVPFALLREFARRHAFAHLRMSHALIQDFMVSALQIGGLAWLWRSGSVTAVTATLALFEGTD